MSKPVDELSQKRLILVTGKGGAGKSSLSIALAFRLAATGKKVWLVEIGRRRERAFSRLPELLGQKSLSHEGDDIEYAGAKFRASILNPTMSLAEYVDLKLPIGGLASVLLNNKVTASLLEIVPGLPELVSLGKLWFALTGEKAKYKPDIIIIDGPASGHAVTLLRAPRNFKNLTKTGPLYRDAVQMMEFLESKDHTAVLFTTIPEEMSLSEAAEYKGHIQESASAPFVIVNKMFPPPVTMSGEGETQKRAYHYFERRNEREHEALREFQDAQKGWACVPLPFLFPDETKPVPMRLGEEL